MCFRTSAYLDGRLTRFWYREIYFVSGEQIKRSASSSLYVQRGRPAAAFFCTGCVLLWLRVLRAFRTFNVFATLAGGLLL
jgi:hypothetical protein